MHLLFAKTLSNIPTVPLYWVRLTGIGKNEISFSMITKLSKFMNTSEALGK